MAFLGIGTYTIQELYKKKYPSGQKDGKQYPLSSFNDDMLAQFYYQQNNALTDETTFEDWIDNEYRVLNRAGVWDTLSEWADEAGDAIKKIDTPSKTTTPPKITTPKKNNNTPLIIAGVTVGVLFIGTIVILAIRAKNKKK